MTSLRLINRSDPASNRQRVGEMVAVLVIRSASAIIASVSASSVSAEEPAEAFVKQLRSVGYFDTAIVYLDRAGEMPGVPESFIKAIPLEKAQTYIELARETRNPQKRDAAFLDAEESLKAFLDAGDHPRISEARLRLGQLQMFRGARLMFGQPASDQRSTARDSYLAAAETFDSVVSKLFVKLKELRGQQIDASKNPDAAASRDQYQFDYLFSKSNAAESIKLAGQTYENPKQDGAKLLADAADRFEDLNKKYGEYVFGATALMHLGQIRETLGEIEAANDFYLQMLEQGDADNLRDAKYLAAAGYIRTQLNSKKPSYQTAIDRTAGFAKDIRPNEKTLPSVQEFRVDLAKAYLAKAADDSLRKGEIGRAKSEGRRLLQAANEVAGPHVENVTAMLADLGIEKQAEPLPTAKPPKSFDEAMEVGRRAISIVDDLEKTLKLLAQQPETPELIAQTKELQNQIDESYRIGVETLRSGLTMVNSETSLETINQARQFMTYFLFQTGRHRETVVVGSFLARQSPGSEVGLRGGRMALQSLRTLLSEVPESENEGLLKQLESLGAYLSKTWPDNPEAAGAKGTQIQLLIKKDEFDAAEKLIREMADGTEKGSFMRLIGTLYWNQSVLAQVNEKDESKALALREKSKRNLIDGLNLISGNLVALEGIKAAGLLAKLHYLQDDAASAMQVLDHPDYGPLALVEKLDAPEAFVGDLYSTELKVLVAQMIASDNPEALLERMTKTTARLRSVFKGDEAQQKLSLTYRSLANDLRAQLETAAPAKKAKLIE
ncbi:MAG: hypothetical protein AAF745_11130, partial [Planctomycetota bacterium]